MSKRKPCETLTIHFGMCRSTEEGANDSYWRRNEITVVITAISFFFPMFFEGLGFLESYHPRKQLRMQLARYVSTIDNKRPKIGDFSTTKIYRNLKSIFNHNPFIIAHTQFLPERPKLSSTFTINLLETFSGLWH